MALELHQSVPAGRLVGLKACFVAGFFHLSDLRLSLLHCPWTALHERFMQQTNTAVTKTL